MSRLTPRSLYVKKIHMCLHSTHFTEENFESKVSRYVGITSLTPVWFQPLYYSTLNFNWWWSDYHNQILFDVAILSKELTATFTEIRDRFKKGNSDFIHVYFQ